MPNCVCETLSAIVDAQDKVKPGHSEPIGCHRSIQELVHGAPVAQFNAIPVILTYGSTGLPFTAIGAVRSERDPYCQGSAFIPSAVFKVVDVDCENSCAILEPLFPRETGIPPLSYLENIPLLLEKLQHTPLAGNGASVAVDLECFCSVTCLAPQTISTVCAGETIET